MGRSTICNSMQERLQMVLIFIGFTLATLVIYYNCFALSIITILDRITVEVCFTVCFLQGLPFPVRVLCLLKLEKLGKFKLKTAKSHCGKSVNSCRYLQT